MFEFEEAFQEIQFRAASPFNALLRLDRVALAMVRAMVFGDGPATTMPMGAMAFLKTKPDLEAPDFEFIMGAGRQLDARPWFPGWQQPQPAVCGIRPVLLHPQSKGTVSLRSPDPLDPVQIQFNFFSDPADLPALIRACHLARDIARQPSLDRFRGSPLAPGPEALSDSGDGPPGNVSSASQSRRNGCSAAEGESVP